MRWTPGVVAAVLVTAFLAGCSGDDDGGSTTTSSRSTTGTGGGPTGPGGTTGPGPTSGTGAPTHEHALTLEADALSVAVPANVTFTLGADTTEEATWVLDFGDGATEEGEGLPATVVHAYTVEGNRTASLRATFADGGKGSTTLNLTLLPGTPATPTLPKGTRIGVETITKTGTFGPFSQGIGACGSQEGVSQLTYELPFNATYKGYLAQVVKAGFNLTLGPGNADSDIYFFDPSGTEVAHAANANSPAPTTQTAGPVVVSPDEKILVEQAFASGVYSIQVKACSTANGPFTLTGYWVYHAA